MRNFKKFLSLVMATLMILSVAVITTGAADTTADYTDAAQHLVALKIMKGDNGNLMLDQGVTRYQAALFFVQTVSGETDAAVWNAQKTSAYFKDVVEYGTAIDYAYGRKLVVGRGNGVFGYNDPITYQDMLVMAVRALGYETADMSYPYGYILAAQKLGLTDDVAKTVNYTAPLTRGATAQIMWNMLNIEIAVVDPLTDKILYPDDPTSLTEALTGKSIERVTLLQDAGYASGKITGTIVEFVEAEDDDDVDTVKVVGTYDEDDKEDLPFEREIAVADLGLTGKAKVEYLGLPVTLLVDVKASEFEKKYNEIADDSDATVVYATLEDYTTVENLGNAGNIKVTKDASGNTVYTLDGTKYSEKNTVIEVFKFNPDDAEGWTTNAKADFEKNFKYDTKDAYKEAVNSYGKVQYRVIEGAKGAKDTLEILYTPYEFGQYFTRTIRYNVTSKDAEFVTIAAYDKTATTYKNFDGDETKFVEKTVGDEYKIDSSTKSLQRSQGETALKVTVAGESVKSGDFVFYSYNALDNVLTVAQNCGSFKEGRLTGSNEKNGTVKIDGANVAVGFKGAFSVKDMNSTYEANKAEIAKCIKALEAGKNNVKYIAVDGNLVYMEAYSGPDKNGKNVFDFAIATLDETVMADLLGYKDSTDETKDDKYKADCVALVDESGVEYGQLYLNDDGYVSIAVLNKTTGKFELASLKNFHYGAYDLDAEKFNSKKDVGSLVKYVDMLGKNYTNADELKDIYEKLTGAVIFYDVDSKDGVYDLASTSYEGADNLTLDAGTTTEGLVFSDVKAVTNALKATSDSEVTEARVSLTNDTVIVLIAKDAEGKYVVKYRVGNPGSKYTVKADSAKILSANSSLIVMDASMATKLTFNTTKNVTLENWGKGTSSASASALTYYVALADYAADIDTGDKEGEYVVTLTNLFDLKTMTAVESVEITVDGIKTATAFNDYNKGDVFKYEDGEIVKVGNGVADMVNNVYNLVNDEAVKAVLTDMNFVDDSTITLTTPNVLSADPTDINIKVVTLDISGVNYDDYDFDNAYVDGETFVQTEADKYGVSEVVVNGTSYYGYALATDVIAEINAPTAGVFDNFVNNMATKTIVVPEKDADLEKLTKDDYTTVVINLGAYGTYEDGVLTLTVLKVVTAK